MADPAKKETKQGLGSSGKRNQIHRSQRVMFGWVAAMSALAGFCLVIAWLLIQQLMFHGKVLTEMQHTVGVLDSNIKNVSELQNNVRVLETNQALNSIKANSDDRALQVVLDALPADDNSIALSSSVQSVLIGGSPGVSIDTISNSTSSGVSTGSTTAGPPSTSSSSVQVVPIRFAVQSSDANSLKDMLVRFEKSIRVIDIDQVSIDYAGSKYTMTVQAHGYFEPAKTVSLKKITVQPGSGSKEQ